MSFKVRMVKQTVLCVCVYKMEYQSAMKRNEQFIYMQQLQWIMLSEKELIPNGHTVHNSIYVTFLKCCSYKQGELIGDTV